jgi:hypothetical protein
VHADKTVVLRHVGQAVFPLMSQRIEKAEDHGTLGKGECTENAVERCAACGSSLRKAGCDAYVCDQCSHMEERR